MREILPVFGRKKGKKQRTGAMEPYAFDAEYLRRLQLRDPSTEAHLVEFVGAVVREQLKRSRLPAEQFDDFFQETFLRVLSIVRLGKLPKPKKFAEFVTGVCENLIRGSLWRGSSNSAATLREPHVGIQLLG